MSFFDKYSINVSYLVFMLVITVIFEPNKLSAEAYFPDIMSDYYWGSTELRSSQLTCNTDLLHLLCYKKCGNKYICDNDTCQCTDQVVKMSIKYVEKYYPYGDNKYKHIKHAEADIFDPLRISMKEDLSKKNLREDKIIDHPALRHHIAHFCPNLDVARQCIRGCMKLGKPAFCGKDHVCYCGHRYSSHDENIKVNKDDIYAEFRDLYTKYFGPQFNEQNEKESAEATGKDADVQELTHY